MSQSTTPRTPAPVTVVIPMYNASGTIRRTLDSVAAQSVPVERIVVVDDHSTDDSRALVEAAGMANLEIVSTPRNSGEGAARNTGIRHAQTEWVALLDSDDEWMPEFIEHVYGAAVELGADWAAAGGERVKGFRDESRTQQRLLPVDAEAVDLTRDFWRVALRFIPALPSATLARRDLFERAGYFPEDLRHGPDVAMWGRLWLHGRFVFVNRPLFRSVAVASGLAARRTPYSDVLRGLRYTASSVWSGIRLRRPGTRWYALWFARQIVRRHTTWLAGVLRARRASRMQSGA